MDEKMAEDLEVTFLRRVTRQKIPVTVFLRNGYQTHGVVTDFDAGVVVTWDGEMQRMIYRQAISTMAPDTPVFENCI